MTERPKNPWQHESDWLCTIEMLPDDIEDRASSAENIGHLMAYAVLTNTRMLALLGDPKITTYELLFSFASQQDREQFMSLVRSNDDLSIDDWGDNGFVIPSADEIRDCRPIAEVLPEDVLGRAWMVATTLCAETPPTVN